MAKYIKKKNWYLHSTISPIKRMIKDQYVNLRIKNHDFTFIIMKKLIKIKKYLEYGCKHLV